MRLKCLSINVRGIVSRFKRELVSRELERLNYDVFLLQETRVSCKQQAEAFERLWRGNCFRSFGTGKSASVAVLFSPKFSGNVQRFLFDSDGRILSLLIHSSSFKFNLINIHAPNSVSDCKAFFEQLHNFFLSQGDYVIAGDCNCVDSAIDKFHSDDFHTSDKASLGAFKADFSLVDVFRKLNPCAIFFTWSNSNNSQASRLDRFFISRSLLKEVCSNQVLPCTFSDHDFVSLELVLGNVSNRRSGVWKFNVSLLSDSDFRQLISDLISHQKTQLTFFPTLGDWWDNLRVLIRKSCIVFSTCKCRALNRSRNLITNQLILAKRAFHVGTSRDDSEIKSLEGALSALIFKEA